MTVRSLVRNGLDDVRAKHQDGSVASPSSIPTVHRSIYFYRIERGAAATAASTVIKLRDHLQAAFQLPFEPSTKRYWVLPDGNAISVWPGRDENEFSLATLRRSSLPRQERNGILAELGLGDGAALHEPIHVRIFDESLLGVEYNFYGPRVSRLPAYLSQLGVGVPDFRLDPILRQDAYAQLKAQNGLRLVDFEIRKTYVTRVREASKDFGKALESLSKFSDAEVVGVVLRPEPRARTMLNQSVFKVIKKLARRGDLRDNATRFKVKGRDAETGAMSEIDLLDDALLSSVEIATTSGNSRAVDPTSAFIAIDQSYAKLKDQLGLSPSIGPANDTATD